MTSGVATFAVYAAGMSVVLLAVTVAVAVTHHSLVRRIRGFARYLNRIAGGLLVLAGGYIVYSWAFNLGTDPGQTTGAGPARFIEGLSADATGWFQDLGWPRTMVLFGGVIAAAATIAALGRGPRTPSATGCPQATFRHLTPRRGSHVDRAECRDGRVGAGNSGRGRSDGDR